MMIGHRKYNFLFDCMDTNEKPNKAPSPRTLARHFSEGKVCDYPAETVLSVVNAYGYGYNSIAIPIQIGFHQMFEVNIDAFIYLSQHRTKVEIQRFLLDPNGYMAEVGVKLPTPFDEITPKIIGAMLEDEMYEAIMSETTHQIINLTLGLKPNPWRDRHPERYPAKFMNRCRYATSGDKIGRSKTRLEKASIPTNLLSKLYIIAEFFAMEET